jgi:hypothetical protein
MHDYLKAIFIVVLFDKNDNIAIHIVQKIMFLSVSGFIKTNSRSKPDSGCLNSVSYEPMLYVFIMKCNYNY